jgi:cobaltochelatase CobS
MKLDISELRDELIDEHDFITRSILNDILADNEPEHQQAPDYNDLVQTLKEDCSKVIEEVKNSFSQDITIEIKETGKQIKLPKGTIKHKVLPNVLINLQLRQNIYLVGPAGSGKSYIAEQACELLNLPFYQISVCNQTTQSLLLGYQNAAGHYVRSNFREAFEHGGVFLLDEIDNGNANVLAVLNSALASS